MNRTNTLLIMAASVFFTIMLSACSGCKDEEKEDKDTVSETFISQPADTDPGTPAPSASTVNTSEPDAPNPSSASTNDNDENLHGYKYKYDKSTKYEDGLFDTTPDYIAIPCKLHDRPEQILYRKTYALSYNKDKKQANWVAWHLTRPHTYGDVERPPRAFHDDDDVSNSTHYYDYNKSKQYDRGHLCPAGDNKWDEEAMLETFLMTNVCPQYYELNKGVWNDIEIKCRDWARQEGDVYIVSGPLFYPNKRNRELLGSSRIPVPDAFFKVVLSNKHQGKGIGFLCENRRGSYNLNDYKMTIDEIERITGIDFFPALPDEMEERVESQIGRFK